MINILKSTKEVKEYEETWNKVERYCNFFTLRNWLMAWWDSYGEDKELRIYIMMNEKNTPTVIFPLMLKTEENKTVLTQLSDSCSDYFRIICNSKVDVQVKELMEYVINNEKFDEIVIKNLRADDINTQILIKAVLSLGVNATVSTQERNYYIETYGKYEDYFERKSKNFKHKIKQTRNKNQEFSFEVIYEFNKELLKKLTGLHCEKWNDDMQVSVYNDRRRMRFLESVCEFFASKKYLRIFVLKYKGEIIAYRLGFVYNSIYYDWNTSYDIRYRSKSVGILLCDYVIKYCFKENIKEFDFLRGEEEYKKKFATGNRAMLQLEVSKTRENSITLAPKSRVRQIMRNIKGFVFDLDGVVYTGIKPIVSTIEFINFLLKNNIKVGFLTNTSSKTAESIRCKLKEMGIENDEYFLETASTATAEYMNEKGFKSCAVYGGDGVLTEEIKKNGIEVFEVGTRNQNIEAVVIAYSKLFEYSSLTNISELIASGAKLIATDADKMFSYSGKSLPGTAWILSSVEYVNEVKAEVIGKPNTYSALNLLKKMNISPSNIMVVGDNIDSDIKMAKKIGAASCLLLGGVSNEEDISRLRMEDKPEIVIDNLFKIKKYIEEV